jgi:hypothetical protein
MSGRVDVIVRVRWDRDYSVVWTSKFLTPSLLRTHVHAPLTIRAGNFLEAISQDPILTNMQLPMHDHTSEVDDKQAVGFCIFECVHDKSL